MPRDDLSIDFVQRMPVAETLDPGVILDDWFNRVQNLPEEIRFVHEEVADKDRQYSECLRIIEDRDAKIQRWYKTNGSHEPNPKENALRTQIAENFVRAEQLSNEKISLNQKLQHIMDKHIRSLDIQVKQLVDRSEPGFTNPDEIPSLLRPSAANLTTPIIRPTSVPNNTSASGTPVANGTAIHTNPTLARLPSHAQVRVQGQNQLQQHAASAPTTPAATMILGRQQREGSAGPATKRAGRANSGLGNVPTTSSGLARHASLGPGTPKGSAGGGNGGVARAGSAGPRASSVKASSSTRRGTPTPGVRKKTTNKSNLSRVKKASSRNSPASTAESDLSDAVSGSDHDEVEGRSRGTPVGDGKDAEGDDMAADADDDDEDGNDDRKYCLCHNVSHGDMVACDNDECPYEWFHWSCVGLKSEPNGKWFCPKCTKKLGLSRGS